MSKITFAILAIMIALFASGVGINAGATHIKQDVLAYDDNGATVYIDWHTALRPLSEKGEAFKAWLDSVQVPDGLRDANRPLQSGRGAERPQ